MSLVYFVEMMMKDALITQW